MAGHVDEAPGDLRALADRWREDLASWAIPEEIASQAPQSPWIHPVEMFTVDGPIPRTPSVERAREALPEPPRSGSGRATVLDVGCGGGRAALALVPPATRLVGVDHQPQMLEAFASAAEGHGVAHDEVLGQWPQVEQQVAICEVVVCHHVAYNVADIVPFLRALNRHARSRVVLEVPVVHPLTHLNPLWKRIWGLERPTRPSASDLRDIAAALGFQPNMQTWIDESWGNRAQLSWADRVRYARIRLCLPPEREAEVAAALEAQGRDQPRELATIWWDVPASEWEQG